MENGHTSVEHQFDALKDSLKKLAHRFDTTPEGYLGKAKEQIKAHPYAAIGIAFGIGYLFVNIARRRR